MKRSLALAILSVFALAAPALAQNNRSAVSVNGLDSNPCTPASPCRSFGMAISQTNSGGEVIALDSAGYGPFSVATSMTISGAPGVHAALTVATGNGITVNATGSDTVTIDNLVLIGAGGTNGVFDNQSAEVRVLNCMVRGFSNDGITNLSGRLTVDHCVVLDTVAAIEVNGVFNSARGVVSNCLLETFNTGILVGENARALVTNSVIAGGAFYGVAVASAVGTGSIAASAAIESSTIAYCNVGVNAFANGGTNSATVYLAQDEFFDCPQGAGASGVGAVKSYGNNRFSDVTTVGALTPIALQ